MKINFHSSPTSPYPSIDNIPQRDTLASLTQLNPAERRVIRQGAAFTMEFQVRNAFSFLSSSKVKERVKRENDAKIALKEYREAPNEKNRKLFFNAFLELKKVEPDSQKTIGRIGEVDNPSYASFRKKIASLAAAYRLLKKYELQEKSMDAFEIYKSTPTSENSTAFLKVFDQWQKIDERLQQYEESVVSGRKRSERPIREASTDIPLSEQKPLSEQNLSEYLSQWPKMDEGLQNKETMEWRNLVGYRSLPEEIAPLKEAYDFLKDAARMQEEIRVQKAYQGEKCSVQCLDELESCIIDGHA